MKMKRVVAYVVALIVFGLILSSNATDEARWIWYPGDYGLWWGNELQSQRLQWGSRLTPFWPMYAPETRVLFRKDGLSLTEDEPLEVRCDGHAAFCWTDDKGVYRESSVIGGKFLLPKSAKKIEVKIQNTARPPSIWVKGPHLVSDASWTVGWTTTWDMEENVPVDSSARFTDPSTPPGLKKLPVKEKLPRGKYLTETSYSPETEKAVLELAAAARWGCSARQAMDAHLARRIAVDEQV